MFVLTLWLGGFRVSAATEEAGQVLLRPAEENIRGEKNRKTGIPH